MASQITVADIGGIEPGSTLSTEIARCWMDVANAGGAVGFPFTPVAMPVVQEAVQALATDIDLGRRTVIAARMGEELVGWVSVRFNDSALTAHWAKIERLQSHPTRRGEGIGTALLSHAVEHAASLGLEHLVLAVRGGEHLEPFYERHGWHEVGRHVGALRFADNDDRDEVLMKITLRSEQPARQRHELRGFRVGVRWRRFKTKWTRPSRNRYQAGFGCHRLDNADRGLLVQ